MLSAKRQQEGVFMKKKIGIFLMVGLLSVGSALNVAAAAQPRFLCSNPNCSNNGQGMSSFCYKDYQLYTSGEHKVFLGDPCFARYYRSHGGYRCKACMQIGLYGNHDCKEEHESCGLGIYIICPYSGGLIN